MVTSRQALKKYGDPRNPAVQSKWFELWVVPDHFLKAFSHVRFTALGTIGFPKKIFINKEFRPLLEKALQNLIDRGCAKELKTWDGVFVIRKKVANSSMSLHSWAIAVDVNAWENGYNKKPKLSKGFVKCFTDAGLDWGGTWAKPDGMHFQMRTI